MRFRWLRRQKANKFANLRIRVYTYKAIIVVITRRRDDYEENSYVSVSGCGGGNVRGSGVRRRLQHVREAVCSSVCEAVPDTMRPLCSAVRYVPVAVQLGLQLVNSMPVPEPVPKAVREAVQHLQ